MAPEIKFTSFGIPYLVEFANVRFRSVLKRKHACPKPLRNRSHSSSSSASASSDTSLGSSLATASSETLASAYDNTDDGDGLLIEFAAHQSESRQMLSERNLTRMKYMIANAAVAAGMTAPSATDRADPVNRAMQRLSRRFEAHTHDPQQHAGSTSSFYRGTYGQLMAALQSAGLMTTPCKASGIEDGRQLGALFVASHTGTGTVELRKLTLWA
ncbi:hypothetical protein QCA50_002221 [Cerrena zonata]|uniref:Uncharacterized protein n=1 Tax=Cerrena zonata TaxID=2478898 RepID=A0AAW0GNT2_9APHY